MPMPSFDLVRTARCVPPFLLTLLMLLSAALLSACNTIPADYQPLTPAQQQAAAPIRFLLTFDDGPSASTFFSNSTMSILNDLDHNPVQPGIKAVFFVQTRASNGGGTPLGKQLQQREEASGHLVGLHTSTPRGHLDQVNMKPAQLEQALTDGVADLTALAGTPPLFTRPPFWDYNERTFLAYQAHGLHMILTDLSANDGKIYGVNFSLTRRSHMLRELAEVRQQIAHGAMPIVDGAIPVIVTFHDINRYTARHMQEYLQILIDSARELQLPTAAKPFYDDRVALQQALLQRAVQDGRAPVKLPGLWNLLSHRSE
ncbi:MAG TPA: polysaccharide deacetylase family protein [Herbaspirillum sp.]|jgi:peptidoglycan/xylan/chitin deacetylase (PgdA/CDA1 family)|nr:polysaccharide deacetylase family protein [Herbaspirillum sp.]